MRALKWMAANWVKIALTVATVIYLPFAYGLIKDTGACAPPIADDHPYWEFYYRYLACRKVNEVGDTFAGFFAPLAFIWLAGAVYIQSQELAAQREELNETQEVMREQLGVSKQQVDETRASTELFRIQTEILQREQKLREQQQADKEFEAMIHNFKLFVKRNGGIYLRVDHWAVLPWAASNTPNSDKANFPQRATICPADVSDFDMNTITSLMKSGISEAVELLKENGITVESSSWNADLSKVIQSELRSLHEKESELSQPSQIMAQRLDLTAIAEGLKQIDQTISRTMVANAHLGRG